jgi:hypothetical protein
MNKDKFLTSLFFVLIILISLGGAIAPAILAIKFSLWYLTLYSVHVISIILISILVERAPEENYDE